MKRMYPQRLLPSDEIRVLAPADSLSCISKPIQRIAEQRLKNLGFRVTYGQNSRKKNQHNSSSIAERISDLHDAFKNPHVKMILTAKGGYNSNQLLPFLNYELIKKNPKILCGFSDITALTNAIYTKTGLVTYAGPTFMNFGMQKGLEYTVDTFMDCLTNTEPLTIMPAKKWSDDQWKKNQERRVFMRNTGMFVLQFGQTTGTSIGGNLCTFNLLQGTSYLPPLDNTVLFIEDDDLVQDESFAVEFERNLVSLFQQPKSTSVRGIVFGRFQKKSCMTEKKLMAIVKELPLKKSIPIIGGADFGHTTPQLTFPIGGQVKIIANTSKPTIILQKY